MLRRSHSLYNRPTTIKTPSEFRLRKTQNTRPFRYRMPLSIVVNKNYIARVIGLLFGRSPIAIFFAIPLVVISSFYRKIRGAIPHVKIKIIKIYPSFIKSYSSCAIPFKSRIFRIRATRFHSSPTVICAGIRTAMFFARFDSALALQTPARLSMFISKVSSTDKYTHSAFATAKP